MPFHGLDLKIPTQKICTNIRKSKVLKSLLHIASGKEWKKAFKPLLKKKESINMWKGSCSTSVMHCSTENPESEFTIIGKVCI